MSIADDCKRLANRANSDSEVVKRAAAEKNYTDVLERIRDAANSGDYEIFVETYEDCGTHMEEMLKDDGFSVESSYTLLCGAFLKQNYNISWF